MKRACTLTALLTAPMIGCSIPPEVKELVDQDPLPVTQAELSSARRTARAMVNEEPTLGFMEWVEQENGRLYHWTGYNMLDGAWFFDADANGKLYCGNGARDELTLVISMNLASRVKYGCENGSLTEISAHDAQQRRAYDAFSNGGMAGIRDRIVDQRREIGKKTHLYMGLKK